MQVLGLWWEDSFAPRRAEAFVDTMRNAFAPTCTSQARPASYVTCLQWDHFLEEEIAMECWSWVRPGREQRPPVAVRRLGPRAARR